MDDEDNVELFLWNLDFSVIENDLNENISFLLKQMKKFPSNSSIQLRCFQLLKDAFSFGLERLSLSERSRAATEFIEVLRVQSEEKELLEYYAEIYQLMHQASFPIVDDLNTVQVLLRKLLPVSDDGKGHLIHIINSINSIISFPFDEATDILHILVDYSQKNKINISQNSNLGQSFWNIVYRYLLRLFQRNQSVISNNIELVFILFIDQLSFTPVSSSLTASILLLVYSVLDIVPAERPSIDQISSLANQISPLYSSYRNQYLTIVIIDKLLSLGFQRASSYEEDILALRKSFSDETWCILNSIFQPSDLNDMDQYYLVNRNIYCSFIMKKQGFDPLPEIEQMKLIQQPQIRTQDSCIDASKIIDDLMKANRELILLNNQSSAQTELILSKYHDLLHSIPTQSSQYTDTNKDTASSAPQLAKLILINSTLSKNLENNNTLDEASIQIAALYSLLTSDSEHTHQILEVVGNPNIKQERLKGYLEFIFPQNKLHFPGFIQLIVSLFLLSGEIDDFLGFVQRIRKVYLDRPEVSSKNIPSVNSQAVMTPQRKKLIESYFFKRKSHIQFSDLMNFLKSVDIFPRFLSHRKVQDVWKSFSTNNQILFDQVTNMLK